MKNTKQYKERRLWYFKCDGCGHKAQSHRRFKAIAAKCRNCRRNAPHENQESLFVYGIPVTVSEQAPKDKVLIQEHRKRNTKSDPRVP